MFCQVNILVKNNNQTSLFSNKILWYQYIINQFMAQYKIVSFLIQIINIRCNNLKI